MSPVVCFYKQGHFLFSEDYLLLSCSDDHSVQDFLLDVESEYCDHIKILQVNFDAFSKIPSHKKKLYPGKKALVYVLKSFEILEEKTLLARKSNVSAASTLGNYELLNTKQHFENSVHQIRNMISQGRFYQVNLTSAFAGPAFLEPWACFLGLFPAFQGEYKAYLPTQAYSILSFSPELFLEKNGNILKTQPIKGSSRSDVTDDSALLSSEKEQAELSMIVDLLRNDLNSLSLEHPAVVTKHREVMKLNYIHHTYSEIQTQTDQGLPFILKKLMPGGSISGCPKKESLLAIEELENYQRQAYTGTIGWWQGHDFSLNITIRSFVSIEEQSFYFAGCGIVYDSNPEVEFKELINKTGSLNVHYK